MEFTCNTKRRKKSNPCTMYIVFSACLSHLIIKLIKVKCLWAIIALNAYYNAKTALTWHGFFKNLLKLFSVRTFLLFTFRDVGAQPFDSSQILVDGNYCKTPGKTVKYLCCVKRRVKCHGLYEAISLLRIQRHKKRKIKHINLAIVIHFEF